MRVCERGMSMMAYSPHKARADHKGCLLCLRTFLTHTLYPRSHARFHGRSKWSAIDLTTLALLAHCLSLLCWCCLVFMCVCPLTTALDGWRWKGVEYRRRCVVIIGMGDDDPIFGCIEEIYIIASQVYLHVSAQTIIKYSSHFHAYVIAPYFSYSTKACLALTVSVTFPTATEVCWWSHYSWKHGRCVKT